MLDRAAVETMLGTIKSNAAKPTNLIGTYVQELLLHDRHQRLVIDAQAGELQRLYDESHTQVDRG